MLVPSTDGFEVRWRADRRLLHRLLTLAADPFEPPALRRKARVGARLFVQYWLGPGYSGHRVPVDIRLPLHGNWCGPGHGRGRAVDRLDAICRAHDRAYQNAELLDELEALWS